MKTDRSLSPAALAALLFLPAAAFLAGCATAPKAPERTSVDLVSLLPARAPLYMVARVPGNEELIYGIAEMMMGKGALQVLERSDRLACALAPVRMAAPRFTFAMAGHYPSSFIKMALSTDSSFTNKGAWYERKDSVQFSVPDESLILISNGGVAETLARAKRFSPGSPQLQASAGLPWAKEGDIASPIYPDDVLGAFRESDIALYAPEPNARLFPEMMEEPPEIPIDRVTASLVRENSTYKGIIFFTMNSDRDAKIFLPVVKLLAKTALAQLPQEEAKGEASAGGGKADAQAGAPSGGARSQIAPVFTLSGRTIRIEGVSLATETILSLTKSLVSANNRPQGSGN